MVLLNLIHNEMKLTCEREKVHAQGEECMHERGKHAEGKRAGGKHTGEGSRQERGREACERRWKHM